MKPHWALWAAALTLCALPAAQAQENAPSHAPTGYKTQAPAPACACALPDFANLVQQVGPSVVKIRTTERMPQGGDAQMNQQMQDFLRRFFGPNLPPGFSIPGGPKRPRQALPDEEQPHDVGSGFILTPDGYVMTNAHVVEGASKVIITLTDKREFTAKVIGSDRRTDVAVLKIKATGLPAVRIGDVGKLRVGEWVLAIGSPFGLENTVTAGIVSAKQRDTGDYLPFIQTDVAVNPGNSGGPLINMRGEVVGINNQIYSRSGGFMGISFSIPIDEAIRVSDQLRATGHVTRGRIGVQIETVPRDVAESIGLKNAEGAQVVRVEPGSPGEKAGIEAGDIITRFNGQPIATTGDLLRMVGQTKPGTKVTATVFRRGNARDLTVTVSKMESDPITGTDNGEDQQPQDDAASSASAKAMGLTVSEISPAQQRQLKLHDGGVFVESVSGAAARAGLREGDVVLAVGNQKVTNLRDFKAAAAKANRGKQLTVLFQRGDWAQYALIRPEKE
ncbi:MAG: DegQ family serine endoprotease [Burkholderiaceae bacterium]|nr:DegQ family serine endoprotease [Burkholderiaceae bacterium]